jgi:ornithine cyclodeaminase/alanine dehydrogenase-like protein (mu-crystallin family)
MPDEILILGRSDLEALEIDWTSVVDVLEDAFRYKAAGLVQNPPKPAIHPRPESFINAMPAYIGGSDRAGLKWVAGYESNRAIGLPYIYGVFLLTDAATGRPLAVMDGGWITEIRTAGVSGVALRQLSRPVSTLAIVGCGVQGRRNLSAILAGHPEIAEVRAYDRAPAATAALLALAGDRRTITADSPEAALDGADVVVTAVTVPMGAGRLNGAGATGNAVFLPLDYDDALAPSVAQGAGLYTVGDLGQYRSTFHENLAGFPEPHGELGDIVAGTLSVPTDARSVLMHLGIAMDDVALGGLAYDRAIARGMGQRVAFP